eukprot:g2968.t1
MTEMDGGPLVSDGSEFSVSSADEWSADELISDGPTPAVARPRKRSDSNPPFSIMLPPGQLRLFELLNESELFAAQSSEQNMWLARHMPERTIAPGEAIVREGARAHELVLLASGVATCSCVAKTLCMAARPGDIFGEAALINADGALHASTVVATEPCTCFTLSPTLLAQSAQQQGVQRLFAAAAERVDELKLLGPAQRAALASKLVPARFAPGLDIIRQGERAPSGAEAAFFLILNGQCEVRVRAAAAAEQKGEAGTVTTAAIKMGPDCEIACEAAGVADADARARRDAGEVVAVLTAGQHFGADALIYGARRNATVRAMGPEPVEVVGLSTLDFAATERLHLSLIAEKVPILAELSDSERERLLTLLQPVAFADGETIVRQGDEGDSFFLVTGGSAHVIDEGVSRAADGGPGGDCGGGGRRVLTTLYEGHCFGELALLEPDEGGVAVRTATVCAVGGTRCMALSRRVFREAMQDAALKGFHARIVAEGARKHLVRHRRASAAAAAQPPGAGVRRTWRALHATNASSQNRVLNDYELLQSLGRGRFGTVHLVQHCRTRARYAMKVVAKAVARAKLRAIEAGGEIEDEGEGEGEAAHREVTVMAALRHPRVVALVEIIDDPVDTHMYIVQEFVGGGPLLRAAANAGGPPWQPWPEARARAMLRDMLCALCYLQFKGVCHRDIKPENILLVEGGGMGDESGSGGGDDSAAGWAVSSGASAGVGAGDSVRVKLADFGEAMRVNPRVDRLGGDKSDETPASGAAAVRAPGAIRGSQVAGSPLFMAPELHDPERPPFYDGFASDVWSLGVVLYATLTGRPPFEAHGELELGERVRGHALRFQTADSLSPDARHLMMVMLAKGPRRRATVDDVCHHAWLTEEGSQRESEAFRAAEQRALEARAKQELEEHAHPQLQKHKAQAVEQCRRLTERAQQARHARMTEEAAVAAARAAGEAVDGAAAHSVAVPWDGGGGRGSGACAVASGDEDISDMLPWDSRSPHAATRRPPRTIEPKPAASNGDGVAAAPGGAKDALSWDEALRKRADQAPASMPPRAGVARRLGQLAEAEARSSADKIKGHKRAFLRKGAGCSAFAMRAQLVKQEAAAQQRRWALGAILYNVRCVAQQQRNERAGEETRLLAQGAGQRQGHSHSQCEGHDRHHQLGGHVAHVARPPGYAENALRSLDLVAGATAFAAGCSDFDRVLREYVVMHNRILDFDNDLPKHDRRVLVYGNMAFAGLGNRIPVYVNFFLLCVLNKRACLVLDSDQEAAGEFFEAMQVDGMSWDWRYSKEIGQRLRSKGLEPETIKIRLNTTFLEGTPDKIFVNEHGSEPTWAYAQKARPSGVFTLRLLHEALSRTPGATMLTNKHYERAMERAGLHVPLTWMSAGCVMRAMFQPRQVLLDNLAPFLDMYERASTVVAVHVRFTQFIRQWEPNGPMKQKGEALMSKLIEALKAKQASKQTVFDALDTFVAGAASTHGQRLNRAISTVFRCAEHLASGSGGRPLLFIASDSKRMEDLVAAVYGSDSQRPFDVVSTPQNPNHSMYSTGKHILSKRVEPCLNVRKAVIDKQVGDASPGPARYTHHPAIARQVESTRKSCSSMKFGNSNRPPLLDAGGDTPGPRYEVKSSIGTQHASHKRTYNAIRFGTSKRPPLLDAGVDTPGAKYDSVAAQGKQVLSTKRSLPIAGIGTSLRPPLLDTGGDTPGAKYKLEDAYGRQYSSNRKSAPGWSMGKSNRPALLDTGADTPGAKYGFARAIGRQGLSTKRSQPTMKFGTSTRPPLLDTGADTPGPKYAVDSGIGKQVQSSLGRRNRRSAPAFSLGAR